jgi:hypothetical protein
MKTKDEILKLNYKELFKYKWSSDLDAVNSVNKGLDDCTFCFNCDECTMCSDLESCKNCYGCVSCVNLNNGIYCRNLKFKKTNDKKYYITNCEVSKNEWLAKLEEIKNEVGKT